MGKLILRGLSTKRRRCIVYTGNHPESRRFVGGEWVTFRKGLPVPVPERWARALVEAQAGFSYGEGAAPGVPVVYGVVRNLGMGDIVLTTPTVRAVQAAWPWARIIFYTEARYLPLLRHQPFEAAAMEGGVNADMRFNLCLVSETAGDRRHAERVDIYARECGVRLKDRTPRVFTDDAEKAEGGKILRGHGWTGRPLLGVQPISSRPERDYTLDRLAEVVRFVVSEGWEVALFHNEPIDWAWDVPVVDLTGICGLGGMLNAVANCAGFLGVDSGVTHVAAAHGIPTVALTGPIRGQLRYACYPNVIIVERGDLRCVTEAHECYRCVRGNECLKFDPAVVIRALGNIMAAVDG